MINSTLCYLHRRDPETGGRQVLMLHRTKKENDVNHDKWIGVGGKFEEGESPEECVIREVKEETGLTLTDWRYRGLVTFVNDQYETERMHLFTSDAFTGALTDCDEGELVWMKREQLDTLPQWEGDRIFHRLLKQTDTPFFSLKLVYDANETLVHAMLDGEEIESEEQNG